jgi:hypothetical protein
LRVAVFARNPPITAEAGVLRLEPAALPYFPGWKSRLVVVDEVTTHFRMPNSFERSKMRAVCRHLADALDRCSGSTLQQRWNDFEKRFWPKWKAGVDRRGREYWTWVHAS